MQHPDTFQPEQPAYARRDVRFRGKDYLAGEEFPHQRLDPPVPKQRLQALWNSRLIAFGAPPDDLALRALERREVQPSAAAPSSGSAEVPTEALPVPIKLREDREIEFRNVDEKGRRKKR